MNDRNQESAVRGQEAGARSQEPQDARGPRGPRGKVADVRSSHRQQAFTLVETLVVVAIIAMLAGLIVGLAGRAGESKIRKRAEVEVQQLVMAIENYKSKLGYYPPDNPNDSTHTNNALYYELTGTRIPSA